jgi:hypothetical protein
MSRIFEAAVRDEARRQAEMIIKTRSTSSNVGEGLVFSLQGHAESIFRKLQAGMDPAAMPADQYTILGVDCSVARRPR